MGGGHHHHHLLWRRQELVVGTSFPSPSRSVKERRGNLSVLRKAHPSNQPHSSFHKMSNGFSNKRFMGLPIKLRLSSQTQNYYSPVLHFTSFPFSQNPSSEYFVSFRVNYKTPAN
jgi:hypothetical protein